jgi:hypothetical protein
MVSWVTSRVCTRGRVCKNILVRRWRLATGSACEPEHRPRDEQHQKRSRRSAPAPTGGDDRARGSASRSANCGPRYSSNESMRQHPVSSERGYRPSARVREIGSGVTNQHIHDAPCHVAAQEAVEGSQVGGLAGRSPQGVGIKDGSGSSVEGWCARHKKPWPGWVPNQGSGRWSGDQAVWVRMAWTRDTASVSARTRRSSRLSSSIRRSSDDGWSSGTNS